MHMYLGDMRRNPGRHPLRTGLIRLLWFGLTLGLALGLAACGGRKDDDEDKKSRAEQAEIGDVRHVQGSTVFVANLSFNLRNYDDLASLAYSITPGPSAGCSATPPSTGTSTTLRCGHCR